MVLLGMVRSSRVRNAQQDFPRYGRVYCGLYSIVDLIQRADVSYFSVQNTCLDELRQSANEPQLERERDACHEAAEPESFDFPARSH